MQAFARRGVFYALQHNRPLLGWSLRRTLGAGFLVLLAVVAGGYLLLERGLHAYTPAATRAFLLFGISIGAFLLAFCRCSWPGPRRGAARLAARRASPSWAGG